MDSCFSDSVWRFLWINCSNSTCNCNLAKFHVECKHVEIVASSSELTCSAVCICGDFKEFLVLWVVLQIWLMCCGWLRSAVFFQSSTIQSTSENLQDVSWVFLCCYYHSFSSRCRQDKHLPFILLHHKEPAGKGDFEWEISSQQWWLLPHVHDRSQNNKTMKSYKTSRNISLQNIVIQVLHHRHLQSQHINRCFKPRVKFSLNPSEKDKNTLKIGLHRTAVTFKA